MNLYRLLTGLVAISLLSSCNTRAGEAPPTPMPPEYLPTAIALTIAAGAPSTAVPNETAEALVVEPVSERTEQPADPAVTLTLPSLSGTLPASVTPSVQVTSPLTTSIPTPILITLPPPPTATPLFNIPEATIQIFRIGDLSRVVSPLEVSAFVKRGGVGPLTIELHGEDGRLLVRVVESWKANPETWANLTENLDFAISAAAEVGRLVISTQDEFKRLKAVNSVNLILLSTGEQDLNPASALQETIFIQQPKPKALIQGGKVLVSGIARPYTSLPLHIELVTQDGRVAGQRLASITIPPDGGYGPFAVEVPYQVDKLTPARLLVYETGEQVSEIAHLSSLEVVLSP